MDDLVISDIELPITLQLLNKDLEIEILGEQIEIEEIIRQMVKALQPLLDKDMERLLHLFYRLDLNENKVKAILSSEKPEQIAHSLAILILKRELQKAQTRILYR